MNEERNYEVIENEDVEVEVYEEPETSSRGIGRIILGAGALVIAGTAVLVHKNRRKLEERKIKKLEKKGYVIIRPENPEEEELEEDSK